MREQFDFGEDFLRGYALEGYPSAFLVLAVGIYLAAL
jgi:hypothetical protein